MMKKRMLPLLFSSLLILGLFSSCLNTNEPAPLPNPGQQEEWLIPVGEVRDGGPGKDGIPSIDAPKFASVDLIDFLQDDDLIIGVYHQGTIKGYPHPILDWHEIVNDDINGLPLAVTYCPLTGTAIGWERTLNGQVTTFGVSGLLYNTNLIPYDRETDSNWSQMLLKSVNGSLSDTQITTYPVIETTWATWKKMFPNAEVLTRETGFNRDYGVFPYGDYRVNNNNIIFPISVDDDRLTRKTRGLGVIVGEAAKFYQVDAFGAASVVAVPDNVGGSSITVVGSREDNYVMAYKNTLPDGTQLNLEAITDNPEAVLKDQEGNLWNLFGVAVSGPRAGSMLSPAEAFIGYWFAWGTFYPGLDIYTD